MTTAEGQQVKRDPNVRLLSEFYGTVPLGLSKFDAMRRHPGRGFVRTTGTSTPQETRVVPTDPDMYLCQGAAVGKCEDRLVRHIYPGYGQQKFQGFVERMVEPGKCCVLVRGMIVLSIPGVTRGDERKAVFACGADAFTLDPNAAGVEIGAVWYLDDRPGRCHVQFKPWDDSQPLKLETPYR